MARSSGYEPASAPKKEAPAQTYQCKAHSRGKVCCAQTMLAGINPRLSTAAFRTGYNMRARSVQCASTDRRQERRASQFSEHARSAARIAAPRKTIICAKQAIPKTFLFLFCGFGNGTFLRGACQEGGAASCGRDARAGLPGGTLAWVRDKRVCCINFRDTAGAGHGDSG